MSLDQYQPARHAVCFLLMNKEGQILSISRGKNTQAWALPGGSVEPKEDLKEAVIREVYEETGFVIANPEPVYCAFVPDEENTIVTTFISRDVRYSPDAPHSDPFEGYVKWQSLGVLIRYSPFRTYNKALFKHLNLITDEWEA
jgi:8-oxo-dGTP pyrophosphatase MutT (NUDIX family)